MEKLARKHLNGLQGSYYLPGCDDFDEALAKATSENQVMIGRLPAIIIQPACSNDIVLSFRFVKEALTYSLVSKDVPLTVCGGGHSELGVMDQSVLLQMLNFTSIVCKPKQNQVEVGAGVTLGPLSRAVGKHGLACALGTWETVGCGLLLQGGVGHLTRYGSVSTDNVLEIHAVFPNGETKVLNNKSKGMDEDLFWGLRGAGPALAVVTKLTLRTFPIATLSHSRMLTKLTDIEESVSYLSRCEAVLRSLPREQSCDIMIGSGNDNEITIGMFPMSLNSKPFENTFLDTIGCRANSVLTCNYCEYPGSSLVDESVNSGGTEGEDIFSVQTAAGIHTNMRHLFVDKLGPKAWTILLKAIMKRPTKLCSIGLQHAGGAVRETKAGIFNCRKFEYSLVIGALWTSTSPVKVKDDCINWSDTLWEEMLPFATGTYAADVDGFKRPEKAPSELQLAFGDNLDKLVRIKKQVDPSNLLTGNYLLKSFY